MNSVIMFIDILIVAYPLRLYHVIQPIAFGVSFGIFSYIYYLCGGVNLYDQMKVNHPNLTEIDDFCFFFFRHGHPFIYNVLDWRKPEKASVTVFGTLMLAIIVHTLLFWIYKLRVYVQRKFFTTELILPTKTSKNRLNDSQGSQISMVFGAEEGCTNEAFKTSTYKVSS